MTVSVTSLRSRYSFPIYKTRITYNNSLSNVIMQQIFSVPGQEHDRRVVDLGDVDVDDCRVVRRRYLGVRLLLVQDQWNHRDTEAVRTRGETQTESHWNMQYQWHHRDTEAVRTRGETQTESHWNMQYQWHHRDTEAVRTRGETQTESHWNMQVKNCNLMSIFNV